MTTRAYNVGREVGLRKQAGLPGLPTSLGAGIGAAGGHSLLKGLGISTGSVGDTAIGAAGGGILGAVLELLIAKKRYGPAGLKKQRSEIEERGEDTPEDQANSDYIQQMLAGASADPWSAEEHKKKRDEEDAESDSRWAGMQSASKAAAYVRLCKQAEGEEESSFATPANIGALLGGLGLSGAVIVRHLRRAKARRKAIGSMKDPMHAAYLEENLGGPSLSSSLPRALLALGVGSMAGRYGGGKLGELFGAKPAPGILDKLMGPVSDALAKVKDKWKSPGERGEAASGVVEGM